MKTILLICGILLACDVMDQRSPVGAVDQQNMVSPVGGLFTAL
jgi:hypothetical protein